MSLQQSFPGTNGMHRVKGEAGYSPSSFHVAGGWGSTTAGRQAFSVVMLALVKIMIKKGEKNPRHY